MCLNFFLIFFAVKYRGYKEFNLIWSLRHQSQLGGYQHHWEVGFLISSLLIKGLLQTITEKKWECIGRPSPLFYGLECLSDKLHYLKRHDGTWIRSEKPVKIMRGHSSFLRGTHKVTRELETSGLLKLNYPTQSPHRTRPMQLLGQKGQSSAIQQLGGVCSIARHMTWSRIRCHRMLIFRYWNTRRTFCQKSTFEELN